MKTMLNLRELFGKVGDGNPPPPAETYTPSRDERARLVFERIEYLITCQDRRLKRTLIHIENDIYKPLQHIPQSLIDDVLRCTFQYKEVRERFVSCDVYRLLG